MITGIDHIVLCVRAVDRTIALYEKTFGMQPGQERLRQWSLQLGSNKISLEDAKPAPDIDRHTVPGSRNFCDCHSIRVTIDELSVRMIFHLSTNE